MTQHLDRTTLRTSRLLLCFHTGQTIQHGLGLLGIDTPDKM